MTKRSTRVVYSQLITVDKQQSYQPLSYKYNRTNSHDFNLLNSFRVYVHTSAVTLWRPYRELLSITSHAVYLIMKLLWLQYYCDVRMGNILFRWTNFTRFFESMSTIIAAKIPLCIHLRMFTVFANNKKSAVNKCCATLKPLILSGTDTRAC